MIMSASNLHITHSLRIHDMEPVTEKPRSVSLSEHDYSKGYGNSNVLNSHTLDNNVLSGSDDQTENVNKDGTKHLSEYAGMFSIEQHFVCLACLTCFKTDSALVVHLQIHICKQVTDVRLPEGNIGPHEVHEETVSNDVCETDSTCPENYNITPEVSLIDNLVASDGSIYLPMDLCQYNSKEKHVEFPTVADQTRQQKTLSSSFKPQESSSYLCLICQSRVNCYTDLEMHLKQHLSEGIYNNATDNKKMKDVTGYSQASASVSPIKPQFEANAGSNSYTLTNDGDIVRLHVMQPKNSIKSHICWHCKKLFSSREWLTKHVKREHSLESEKQIQMQDNKLVFCKFCDKAFAYVKLYRSHVKRCHADNYSEVLKPKEPKHCKQPHMCEDCGKIFADRRQCMIHVQRVHSFDKSYLCDICGQSFSCIFDFRIHCRTHEGFKCLKCDLRFKSLYLRRKHQVQHSGVKQKSISIIQCEICKKSFTGTAKCLAYHKRICCLEKTITCTICQKRFALQEHLRSHVKKVHGELKFKCNICSSAFRVKCNLNYHMRKHALERPYKCSLCSYGSISKSGLTTHMRSHSSVKPYSCTICSKSFKKKWTLTQHMMKHS